MYLEHDELDEVVTQERTWALFAHDAVESNDKNKIIFCEAEIIRMGQLIDGYQKKEKKYA